MADSIFDFDPIAANNTSYATIPYGPNQLYHNKIDDLFRAYAGAMGGFVDDLGAVATPTGSATAVAVTLSQGFTAYGSTAGLIRHGTLIALKMPWAATGAATLNVNTIGTKKIRRQGDSAIQADDWLTNGIYFFRYDTAYDTAAGAWVLMNPASSGVAASATVAGIVELLTNTEAVTGADTTRAATANNLSAVRARRNRIVNPAMQISQQNVNTAGTSTGYYAADQWAMYFVSSAGTLTAQRVQSQTTYKSKDRFRVTITAADASLAAGEYLTVTQNIEGQEVADFAYGAAGARQSVLRFGFKGPAGTYSIALHNSAADRSYVKTFSPAVADTDETISIVIPGDTSGTWLTTNGIGITLDFVIAAGSTFQGTDAAWQAGLIYGTASNSNGMGTIAKVFEISDVGLHMDPESTGVAPTWELPEYGADLHMCQRYYEKSYNQDVAAGAVSAVGQRTQIKYIASTVIKAPNGFSVAKRTTPTVIIYNPVSGGANGLRNVSASTNLTVNSVDNPGESGFSDLTMSASVADATLVSYHYTANARM